MASQLTLFAVSEVGFDAGVVGTLYAVGGVSALVGAVFALHAGGFALGYTAGRLLAGDESASRAVSIEVGMQNSGLGVVLARQNFASPLVAIPSAISSLFHSLIGSALAGWWRRSAAVRRS